MNIHDYISRPANSRLQGDWRMKNISEKLIKSIYSHCSRTFPASDSIKRAIRSCHCHKRPCKTVRMVCRHVVQPLEMHKPVNTNCCRSVDSCHKPDRDFWGNCTEGWSPDDWGKRWAKPRKARHHRTTSSFRAKHSSPKHRIGTGRMQARWFFSNYSGRVSPVKYWIATSFAYIKTKSFPQSHQSSSDVNSPGVQLSIATLEISIKSGQKLER